MAKINEMTIMEAAKALDLAPWYLRNMCRLGKFPAKRKRYQWVLPRKLVEAMVAENKDLLGDGVPNAAWLEYEKEEQEEQTK